MSILLNEVEYISLLNYYVGWSYNTAVKRDSINLNN